ncbi:MAG: 50S ribosomal protein L24 [Candidatus Aenigmatarchaeota archaeon]
MKKKFSVKWLSSKQPRKQRKYRYNAPLHRRQKMVSSNLDKLLRKELGVRSIHVRKGDEVQIMRGGFRGKRGSVTDVNLKSMKAYVDNVKRKTVSGKDVQVPIDPSNLKILKLNLDDAKRKKAFEKKRVNK